MHDGVGPLERNQPVLALGHVATDSTDGWKVFGPATARVDTRYEAVENGDGVTTPNECLDDMGTDKPGTAGYENVHGVNHSRASRSA